MIKRFTQALQIRFLSITVNHPFHVLLAIKFSSKCKSNRKMIRLKSMWKYNNVFNKRFKVGEYKIQRGSKMFPVIEDDLDIRVTWEFICIRKWSSRRLQKDSVKLSVIFGEPVDQLICGKLKSPVMIKFDTPVAANLSKKDSKQTKKSSPDWGGL